MLIKRTTKSTHGLLHDISVFFKLLKNQKDIIRLSKQGQNEIHIESKPLVRGNIEHYYHFLFDLVLPLSKLIEKTSSDTVFKIDTFGPLSEYLLRIFPGRVALNETVKQNEAHQLIGMNPIGLRSLSFNYDTLYETAFKNLNITRDTRPNMVLLIERIVPDSYYMTMASKVGGGSTVRSITNHRDLEAIIKEKISGEYEFRNLVLEETSLEDQILYFSKAALVIAQHGAGLSNMIWMREGSTIIEFGFRTRRHFRKLSADNKHNYLEYQNFQEKHIEIDIEHFASWLGSNPNLEGFFKND